MVSNSQSPDDAHSSPWFNYPVQAHPHLTDYAGIVWHGSYISWMEEARIEYLRSLGIEFSDFVEAGCDLPVVDLTIRYHQAIPHGKQAVVKTRMQRVKGVRVECDYRIESANGRELYSTAKVVLVAIDREKRKIMRQLPEFMETALNHLATPAITP
jgi:acyl-CoA thioester hydrolase